jgi:hypothetical protein
MPAHLQFPSASAIHLEAKALPEAPPCARSTTKSQPVKFLPGATTGSTRNIQACPIAAAQDCSCETPPASVSFGKVVDL